MPAFATAVSGGASRPCGPRPARARASSSLRARHGSGRLLRPPPYAAFVLAAIRRHDSAQRRQASAHARTWASSPNRLRGHPSFVFIDRDGMIVGTAFGGRDWLSPAGRAFLEAFTRGG